MKTLRQQLAVRGPLTAMCISASALLLLCGLCQAGALGTFTGTGLMTSSRARHTATLLPNGKILAAGGYYRICNAPEPTSVWKTAELFDPVANTWAPTNTMYHPRESHSATLLQNGMVLVAGGYSLNTSVTQTYEPTAELYDPATGVWIPTGSLHEPRAGHTATLLGNGTVLIAGGSSNAATAELYDPGTGQFTPITAPMAGGVRTNHAAVLLPNGQVLVAGGSGPSSLLRSAELYDPATQKWTATHDLTYAYGNPNLVLLQNGMVLEVGESYTTELYDPGTGFWSLTGSKSMLFPMPQTATLLADGTVLASGIFPQIYDPATGGWAPTGLPIVERLSGQTATLLQNGNVVVAGGESLFNIDCGMGTVIVVDLYNGPAPTAQQRTANVSSQVQGLVSAGTLSSSQGAVLTGKLSNAVWKLNSGQTKAAGNQLGAFSNQVQAFINSGALSPAVGQPLINDVAAIRTQIGS
jgi:WD40 repeat protein